MKFGRLADFLRLGLCAALTPRERLRDAGPFVHYMGCVGIVRADLQVNQVVLAAVVPSHRCKVVLNTGLTIDDRGYNGDYGTPLWGDYAIVKVKPGAAVPEMLTAGLLDEHWQLAK